MTTQRKNKPGQGRKPLGQDRGGLVPLLVNVYRDQKEWLASLPNQQEAVRDALDLKIKEDKMDISTKKYEGPSVRTPQGRGGKPGLVDPGGS